MSEAKFEAVVELSQERSDAGLKLSALKHAGRIIPRSGGFNTRDFLI